MLASDLARAPLVALIPVLHWAGALSFPVLLVVGFGIGAFFPAYASSQLLVLAGLVGEDEVRMTRVGGLLGSVNETASFVGPAVGGLLVALIGPAQVLLVDAVLYLAAVGLVAAFVPSAPAGQAEEEARGALEGLRHIVRDRALFRRVFGLAIVQIGWTALMATLPVLALRHFDGGARLAGWFVAAFGGGSVVGGLVSSRARKASDRFASFAMAGLAVSTWPLLAPLPAWAVVVAVAADGLCTGLFYSRFFAALTVRTPPELRARVVATVMTAISATGPLGFVAAGILLQHGGSATPGFMLVATAATVGATVVVAAGAGTGRGAGDAAPSAAADDAAARG